MSIAESIAKNYDEIIAEGNMTLNEYDIKFFKKMFIEQDEIKEIIISELLDINTKRIIKSIDDVIRSNQIKAFYDMKCQENIVHSELKGQEGKVEALLHLQEETVRELLEQWEKEIAESLNNIKKLL